MKKILLLLGALLLPGASHAVNPILGTVQITTTTNMTPNIQNGTINISSANIAGSLKSTGTVILGGTGKSVTVSSNAVLSGALIANGSAGTSGYVLQSQGPGTTPTWVAPASESILSSTNTWTAGQTFTKQITLSSNVVDGSSSQGASGQSLQSNGGSAPSWVNVPAAILTTTSTWTAAQSFSTATIGNLAIQSNISGNFSGKVKQIAVATVTTSSSTTSTGGSFVPTNLSVSINISSSTSNILLMASGYFDVDFSTTGANLTLTRGNTNLYGSNGAIFVGTTSSLRDYQWLTTPFIVDTPLMTGPTTYFVKFKASTNNTATWCEANTVCSLMAVEIIP